MESTEKTEKKQKKRGNVANLKPFKPGESGNPAGRPKGSLSLVDLLRNVLLSTPPDEDPRTRGQRLVEKIADQANMGDSSAQKLIMNYIEGLPKQTFNIGVDKDNLKDLTDFFRLAAKPPKEDEIQGTQPEQQS